MTWGWCSRHVPASASSAECSACVSSRLGWWMGWAIAKRQCLADCRRCGTSIEGVGEDASGRGWSAIGMGVSVSM